MAVPIRKKTFKATAIKFEGPFFNGTPVIRFILTVYRYEK